jgi:hypothetical protein
VAPGSTTGYCVPNVFTSLTIRGDTKGLQLAGLSGLPRINAPVRTDGASLPGAGIVLERSYAEALGIPLGTAVEVPTADGPIDLRVVGTAILPSQPRYPRHNPGLGWVTLNALEQIEPRKATGAGRRPSGWTIPLRPRPSPTGPRHPSQPRRAARGPSP